MVAVVCLGVIVSVMRVVNYSILECLVWIRFDCLWACMLLSAFGWDLVICIERVACFWILVCIVAGSLLKFALCLFVFCVCLYTFGGCGC